MNHRIKALIVDDEEHCRSSLKKQIEWSCPDVEVIGSASSAKEAESLIASLKPSLVFLDIEMPGGTGFDLIRRLDKIDFSIIFTTAYDEYALEAFKVNAIAYLLKPIDGDELAAAVNKAKTESSEQIGEKLESLIQHIHSSSNSNKIAFPVSDGLEFVPMNDIIRCESEGSYCHVILNDRPNLFLSKTLKQISELINDDKFLRVHHSHLINVDYIRKYIRGKGGQVIMDDGTAIPVSRTKKDSFLENFDI